MGKKKRIYSPFDGDDDDIPGFPFFGGGGGDDDDESPGGGLPGFDEIFKNLMKQFRSKDFMNFSKNLFKQMGLPDPMAGAEGPQDPATARKGRVDIKGPFVYGFSVKFDENGKPIIDKFGNIKAPGIVPAMEADAEEDGDTDEVSALVREPIADIIEEDADILVVVELPGVQKEDIKLNATDFGLEINAVAPPVPESTSPRRTYQKKLSLPAKINPEVAKARYTNGILEVRLHKVGQKPPRTTNVPIE